MYVSVENYRINVVQTIQTGYNGNGKARKENYISASETERFFIKQNKLFGSLNVAVVMGKKHHLFEF